MGNNKIGSQVITQPSKYKSSQLPVVDLRTKIVRIGDINTSFSFIHV